MIKLGLITTLAVVQLAWAAPQPNSVSIVEIAFTEPQRISTSEGAINLHLEAVKVVITGQGFRQKATGPIIWLNGWPTLRTIVAEDGSAVEAYYYQALSDLEAESIIPLEQWNVAFQDHTEAERIPVPGPIQLKLLSTQERINLNALKQKLGIK